MTLIYAIAQVEHSRTPDYQPWATVNVLGLYESAMLEEHSLASLGELT